MKTCFKCGRLLPISEFYRHARMADGHLNKCIDCAKKDSKTFYETHRESRAAYEKKRFKNLARKEKVRKYSAAMRVRNPEKYAARTAVRNAIRDGQLVRLPCEVCGSTNGIEAHHDDYSKPIDVRWLCFCHHRHQHNQIVVSV